MTSMGFGKNMMPSWIRAVPSWMPSSRPLVQTMRNWSTLSVLIWSKGLWPQEFKVRLHINQSAGSGFCSISSVTGVKFSKAEAFICAFASAASNGPNKKELNSRERAILSFANTRLLCFFWYGLRIIYSLLLILRRSSRHIYLIKNVHFIIKKALLFF